jgi:hypothetical protein
MRRERGGAVRGPAGRDLGKDPGTPVRRFAAAMEWPQGNRSRVPPIPVGRAGRWHTVHGDRTPAPRRETGRARRPLTTRSANPVQVTLALSSADGRWRLTGSLLQALGQSVPGIGTMFMVMTGLGGVWLPLVVFLAMTSSAFLIAVPWFRYGPD